MATFEGTEIEGCFVVRPRLFHDARGFFVETWSERQSEVVGIPTTFVQDNQSRSVGGTLRGLHYQAFGDGLPGQAKLVRVARGRIWDVVVDLRAGSSTHGRWMAVILDDVAHEQLFIPAGCAHGFAVLSDLADVAYKISTPWDASLERGLAWNCPELAIPWPVATPILSPRDQELPTLSQLLAAGGP
jgi:dTDP-4-dehydrorhamnose 3,5-epimerase